MKVSIKSFDVDMRVKSKGIELEVSSAGNNSKQLGDCYATMTGLTWCKGKTDRKNGVQIKWADFALICSSEETVKAAIKTAKAHVDNQ